MVTAFERPGEAGDPESWHRRLDGDGAPDRADARRAADHPARRPETEAQAAERLGLTGLNRSDAYDSLRAKADAQEAEIRQREDRKGSEGRDGDGRGEASHWGEAGDAVWRDRQPERDERGSGAPQDAWMTHWTADPTESRPDHDPERRPNYWTEVPRFQAAWHRLEERWPRADFTDKEPVTGNDQRQKSDTYTNLDSTTDRITDAEPSISENVQRAASECSADTWLGGFDFRIKDHERIKEKISDKLNVEPDRDPADLAREIPDAIRYTFCFEAAGYSEGCREVKAGLERRGYEMYYSKNWWDNAEYKGINTRWITPQGQRFEVQFHTAESFHAKHELTHRAYERLRDPTTSDRERQEMRDFQREVSSWIPVPRRVREIPDFRMEGF